MDHARLALICRRQRGLFTTSQARACGFSYKQIRHRLRSGQWQAVGGRVFAEPGVTETAAVRDRIAQLAVPGSVLAGPSAARVWRLPVPDGPPCLIVPSRSHPAYRGARLLRTDIHRADLALGPGRILVTSRERTVVDCLRILGDEPARTLLDLALQRRWITLTEFAERVQRQVGQRGTPRLRRLLRDAVRGARSEAERVMARLLDRAGIRGWAANRAIRDAGGLIGIGDVVFPEIKLVIELDGWAYHSDPEPFQRDRERQNRLVAAGWTVLRFTWRDLTEHPDRVVRTIRSILATR